MHNPIKGHYTQVDRSCNCAIMAYDPRKMVDLHINRHRCDHSILVMAHISADSHVRCVWHQLRVAITCSTCQTLPVQETQNACVQASTLQKNKTL